MKKLIYILLIGIMMPALILSCGKQSLEPTTAQSKVIEGSINNDKDVFSLLIGAYATLTSASYYGRDVIIYGEVRADNCFANGNSVRLTSPASMSMGAHDEHARNTWATMYYLIAVTNVIIGLNPDDISGDKALLHHYIGQAYALRALAHFDLLRIYGQQHVGGTLGIPYMLVYKGDELNIPRNTVEEVKNYIYADLTQAHSWMSELLNNPSREFLTTDGVHALQSRVATYFGDWDKVIIASEVIMNSGAYAVVPKENFVASWHTDAAVNSIFELAFSTAVNNYTSSLSFIYRGATYGDIEVLADISRIFDADDVRGSTAMIGSEPFTGRFRNMGKYPSEDHSDNVSIFRYEEVLLNYAEAHFELGTGDPLEILNQITAARGALAHTSISKDIILLERRRELCFEGFRFDDLARTGRDIPLVDPLKQTHGGPTYGSNNYAFPIPQAEMNANTAMVQNEGY